MLDWLGKQKTIILKVNGMHCVNCENRVNKALKRVKGVKDVSADSEANQVVFKASDKFDISKVKGAIEELGYEVAL